MQSQGRRSRGERPRAEERVRDGFEHKRDDSERKRGDSERKRSGGWTTDAKISAGVLGALATLCLAVVGWRFVESRYFGSTPVDGGSAAPAIAASQATHSPEAIYAVPQIGHGSDDPWSTSQPGSPAPAPGYAHSDSANLLPPNADGAPGTNPYRAPGAGELVSAGRLPLPPQTPFGAVPNGTGPSDAAYGQTLQGASYASAGGSAAVEIRPGDSFWLISERAYGSGAYFKALYRFHEASIAEPDRLPVGQSLEIPPLETLRELFPEDVPSDTSSTDVARLRSYRTKRGDTAMSVAQAQLGDASRWTEVFRLNQRAVAAPDALLPEHYELKLPPAPMMAAAPGDGRGAVAPASFPAVR